jgi:uncharacterized protein
LVRVVSAMNGLFSRTVRRVQTDPEDRPGSNWEWLRDPWLYAAAGLAPLAWLLPGGEADPALWRLAVLALVEEMLFRGLVQEALLRKAFLRRRAGPVTLANIVASAVFVLAHALTQPLTWALAVVFPSLIFGWMWDRHRTILPCSALHLLYNLFFFYRP